MRTSFACVLLALLLGVSCGDDDGAPPGGGVDGSAVVDGPMSIDGAGGDATSGAGQPLGAVCVSGAPDGGVGSCVEGAVCCNAGGNTRCTLPEDCGGGGGLQCSESSPCGNPFICCKVGTEQFCTKQNTCSMYGGTPI